MLYLQGHCSPSFRKRGIIGLLTKYKFNSLSQRFIFRPIIGSTDYMESLSNNRLLIISFFLLVFFIYFRYEDIVIQQIQHLF